MNTMRGSMLALAVHGVVLTLSGCMTAKVYETEAQTRAETVKSVLISSDEKYLVVICEKHHYIFEAPTGIVKLLRSKLHPKVVASFGSLRVDEDGDTGISYGIRQRDVLTPEEQELAMEMGFAKSPLVLTGYMKGKCYDSAGITFETQAAISLNQTYTVTVHYEKPKHPTSVKALATPITLAADGLALALTAPLAPIALIPLLVFKFAGSPLAR